MKGKKIKSLISGIILATTLFMPQIALADNKGNFNEFIAEKSVDNNKVWNIRFNKSVDLSSINKEQIFVEDKSHNKFPVGLQVENEGKEIKVVPMKNYNNGETYFLYVLEDVVDKDAKKSLRKGIKMQFNINNSNYDNSGIAYFPLKYRLR